MNLVDWIIIIFVAFFVLNGLRHGFLRSAAGLVGIIVAFFIAVRFMHEFSAIFLNFFDIEPRIAVLITAAIIFIVVFAGFLIAARLLKAMLDAASLGWADRITGMLLGFTKGVVIASILALIISLFPIGGQFKSELKRSSLFLPVAKVAPIVFNWLVDVLPSANGFYAELQQSLTDGSGYISTEAMEWLNSLKKQADPSDFKPLD